MKHTAASFCQKDKLKKVKIKVKYFVPRFSKRRCAPFSPLMSLILPTCRGAWETRFWHYYFSLCSAIFAKLKRTTYWLFSPQGLNLHFTLKWKNVPFAFSAELFFFPESLNEKQTPFSPFLKHQKQTESKKNTNQNDNNEDGNYCGVKWRAARFFYCWISAWWKTWKYWYFF